MAAFEGLEFLAEGSAFEGGRYDLRAVERLLTDYRRLVDQTLPLALGQKTLTDRIRSEIQYQVRFETGSWRTLLQFLYENKDVFAAVAAVDGGGYFASEYISKLVHAVIELRRWFEEQLAAGRKPKVQLASENKIEVPVKIENVSTRGGDIIVQPVVLIAAELTRHTLDNIIKAVDGDRVRKLTIKAPETKTTITSNDQRITGTLRQELPKTMDITGRLNVVAFDSHRGQLVTENGTFPVTWDDSIRRDIHRYADTDGIRFTVKPIVDNKRFRDDPIGLHILKCRQPQGKLRL